MYNESEFTGALDALSETVGADDFEKIADVAVSISESGGIPIDEAMVEATDQLLEGCLITEDSAAAVAAVMGQYFQLDESAADNYESVFEALAESVDADTYDEIMAEAVNAVLQEGYFSNAVNQVKTGVGNAATYGKRGMDRRSTGKSDLGKAVNTGRNIDYMEKKGTLSAQAAARMRTTNQAAQAAARDTIRHGNQDLRTAAGGVGQAAIGTAKIAAPVAGAALAGKAVYNKVKYGKVFATKDDIAKAKAAAKAKKRATEDAELSEYKRQKDLDAMRSDSSYKKIQKQVRKDSKG